MDVDMAVLDAEHLKDDQPKTGALAGPEVAASSPAILTRSLSDGGNSTPRRNAQLSPPPFFLNGISGHGTTLPRSGSKDDSIIASSTADTLPATPRRVAAFGNHKTGGLSALQPTSGDAMHTSQTPQSKSRYQNPPSTPVSATAGAHHLQQFQQRRPSDQHPPHHLYHNSSYMPKSTPLSPKLDPSQTYASPTNVLPRRSRGLDFSRAATSLHHSTLADQSSVESSPVQQSNNTTGGGIGAINIPGRKPDDFGGTTDSSTSLWSIMGRSQEGNSRTGTTAANGYYPSSSMGSVSTSVHLGGTACSDSSSSSDGDDFMDEDTEEPFVTTPQTGKTTSTVPVGNSPAMNSLLSFTHRQRPRKQAKRKVRGPLGLGYSSIPATAMGGGAGSSAAAATNHSKSPPAGGSGFILGRDAQEAHARRESISWAANQLNISGSESDDSFKPSQMDMNDALGQRGGGVVRRQVTRRGNLLPKTKGFARIRAALAEESAPADADFRRESEVVRQVLESDLDPLELNSNQNGHLATAGMAGALPDPRNAPMLTSPRLLDNMDVSDDMSLDGGMPEADFRTRLALGGPRRLFWNRSTSNEQPLSGSLARPEATTPPLRSRKYSLSSMADDALMDSPGGTASAAGSNHADSILFPGAPMFLGAGGNTSHSGIDAGQIPPTAPSQNQFTGHLPSAADITRRINSKRRRDDGDLDPVSFKRRAVSPSVSVHNSPVMQSPLQRDVPPWGSAGGGSTSRPGSVSGGAGTIGLFEMAPISNGGNLNGNTSNGGHAGRSNKGRVGYQAMADANNSITRLSIE